MRGARAAAAIGIVLLACLPPSGPARGVEGSTPDSTAARAIFEALEARLLATPTVQLNARFRSDGLLVSRLEGPIAVDAGNRAHIEQTGEMGGSPLAVRFTSNGKAVRVDSGEKSLTVGAAGKMTEALLLAFTRMGFLHQIYVLSTAQMPHWVDGTIRDHVAVSDFDLGKDLSIEGKTCRTVRFHISVDGENSGRATLWLDRDGGLPVRRAQEVYFGADTMRVVEEYDHVLLGEDVSAERFLVPNPR
jgi:hypothetical protein